MRILRNRVALMAAAFCLGSGALAHADVTTERSSSILVFPKVLADGTRDTVLEITNTSNSLVKAHCFYVNAALRDPTQPQGPLNPPLWQEIDFSITLTRQQPTQWTVSEGRFVDPSDTPCSPKRPFCPNAGFDPGRVPPVVPDFRGELKCIEVDDSGAPISGNHLIGEATIASVRDVTDDDPPIVVVGSSKYNALGILGQENNGDGTLVLGGGQCAESGVVCSNDEDCGDGGACVLEYNACPFTWILNSAADGAPDITLQNTLDGSGPTSIETELTIVPCTQNFETQIPTTVTIQFVITNEFESQFSVSTSVTCWGNFNLAEVGATALTFVGQTLPDPEGTMYLQTRMRSAAGTPYGMLMVAEELHLAQQSTIPMLGDVVFGTRAAVNLHVEGDRPVPDIITVPDDQLVP